MSTMGRWSFWSSFDVNRSNPLLRTICVKNDFYLFFPGDLDLYPLDRKFTALVVQSHVATKYKVSMAFLFQENLRNGTDRWTLDRRSETLNAAAREPHNNGDRAASHNWGVIQQYQKCMKIILPGKKMDNMGGMKQVMQEIAQRDSN